MANNYCCDHLYQLGNNGYVDGKLLYLQRLDLGTNLPMNLHNYRFCVTCGQNNNGHQTDDILECITLRNGRLNGKFGPMSIYDPNANGNEFAFNLNTREELAQFQPGDPNYPEPIELKFCPYCGTEYRNRN